MIFLIMSGFISFNNEKLKHKVMIVEDESLTLTSLTQILDSYFENIYYAQDGDDGLEMYYREKPDIIFTDIVMPKMNGIEMLQQIQSCNDHNPLIIVFSAFDTTVSDKELDEIGIYKKMMKPFNLKELETLVEDIKSLDLQN